MKNRNAIIIDVPKGEGGRFLRGSSKIVMDFILTVMEAMGEMGMKVTGTAAFGPSEKTATTMMINTGDYPNALMMDMVENAREIFISSHGFDLIGNVDYKEGTAHILLEEDFLSAPKTVADITDGETERIVDAIFGSNIKKNDVEILYDLRSLNVDITFNPVDMPLAIFRTVLRAIVSTINRPELRYGYISIANPGHYPETVKIKLYSDGNVAINDIVAMITPALKLLGKDIEMATGRNIFKSVKAKAGRWNMDCSYYMQARVVIDMNSIQKEDEGR